MQSIPFSCLRISYIYNFRFINLPVDYQDTLLKKTNDDKVKYNGLTFSLNDSDGFQPFIKTTGDVVKVETEDLQWKKLAKDEERKVEFNRLREKLEKVQLLNDELPNKKIDALLRKKISIDSIGTGSLSISLIILPENLQKMELTLTQILILLNMADGAYKPNSYESIGMKKNVTLKFSNDSSMNMWLYSFSEVSKICTFFKGSFSKYQVKWLERDGDKNISNILELKDYKRKKYPIQNPYVYTEIEIDNQHNYEELVRRNHDECGSNCQKGALANMLVRIGPTGLEDFGLNKDYLMREGVDPKHAFFGSFYPSECLHVWTHFRSTISVFPRLDESKAITSVAHSIDRYLIAVRDTVRDIRARWHCLVTQHLYLDQLVNYLQKNWNPSTPDLRNFWEPQKFLVNRRFDMMKILETPIVCRRSASSLNHLYAELSHTYELESLKKDLIEKIRQINDLYQDCYSVRMAEDIRCD